MLPADVYARFLRLSDEEEVLFICATDEHGTPAELELVAAGLPVADFCRSSGRARRRSVSGSDCRGTTSGAARRRRTRSSRNTWPRKLDADGFLEEREIEQIYSVVDQRFLPDRYVGVGTCPHCGYERARGDQCENCTRAFSIPSTSSTRARPSATAPISKCDDRDTCSCCRASSRGVCVRGSYV